MNRALIIYPIILILGVIADARIFNQKMNPRLSPP